MTSLMPGLTAGSRGVQFTARPALRTRESFSRAGSQDEFKEDAPRRSVTPQAKLSPVEVELAIKKSVATNPVPIKNAMQMYDVEHNNSITKGEFRQVLESFCMPLTTPQFESILAKVAQNSNGTVQYLDFLQKFHGPIPAQGNPPPNSAGWTPNRLMGPAGSPLPPREINTDMIEKMLREKVSHNLKAVIKAMQMFDYNMDGKIQQHELRRVLENYCFKLTDQQYNKLWLRYDFHHTGTVNYKEFLERLGVSAPQQNGKTSPNDAGRALQWTSVAKDKPNRFLRGHLRFQQERDQQLVRSLNVDQVEAEFRRRMRENHDSLRKAFIAFDPQLSGLVTLEDLMSILNNFTVPMSPQLFKQIMDRCGIKASHQVSWEAFLDKFQDPQARGNGQTIPVRENHRFFPIRGAEGTQEVVPADQLWLRLYKHVHTHYPSFKDAFLQIDANRSGRITRKDLKRIIEKFGLRLDDSQMKVLLKTLDCDGDVIDYHRFLEIFEERESLAGHKWLNSCHRFNEERKPCIMAWQTIEDILQEKLTEKWRLGVGDLVRRLDTKLEGIVPAKKLKHIIDRNIVPLSEDHWMDLLRRCPSYSEGRLKYEEFLRMLNVELVPGDTVGLSTQIQTLSHNTDVTHKLAQLDRIENMERTAQMRTSFMTPDEVIMRLGDKFNQQSPNLRNLFVRHDVKGKGRLSKRAFRQLLYDMGISLTDVHFAELTGRLDWQPGGLTFTDFQHWFQQPQPWSSEPAPTRTGNHRVNPIRGDERRLDVEEVEDTLRKKLRENFVDLKQAYHKFSESSGGVLTRSAFKHMLDTFHIVMAPYDFELLCARLGIDKHTRMSYVDFLQKFQLIDSAEGHPWLNSVHKYGQVQPLRPMTAEEALVHLKTRTHQQWRDLSQAFIDMNIKNNGKIRKNELKLALANFVMPIQEEEFKRLWKMLDDEGKNYLTYEDFLEKLGAQEFASGDSGPSQRIIAESNKNLNNHHMIQMKKHAEITYNQASLAHGMDPDTLHRKMKNLLQDRYKDLYAAFRNYDPGRRGFITITQIQSILTDLHLYVSERQFLELLAKVGVETQGSRLNYESFLKAFEDGRKSSYENRPDALGPDNFPNLAPAKAEIKLRKCIEAQFDSIARAMAVADKAQTGLIPGPEFRRILDVFCFPLTNAQWAHLQAGLPRNANGMVDYPRFLEGLGPDENATADMYLEELRAAIREDAGPPRDLEDMQQRLQETVTAHLYPITQALATADLAEIGVVPKEQFKAILLKNVLRLSDEQFETLWEILPKSENGNLDYKEFLKQYSSESIVPGLAAPTPRPSSTLPLNQETHRPHTSGSHRPQSRALSRASTSLSRLSLRSGRMTPLVNAEGAERQLKDVVFRHWRDIQRQCRLLDRAKAGTVSTKEIKDILRQHSVEMSPEDFDNLTTKYDLKDDGRFCYTDFLRHFVLQLRPESRVERKTPPGGGAGELGAIKEETTEDGAAAAAGALSAPHLGRRRTTAEGGRDDVFARVQGCVSGNWKEMRRAFALADKSNKGLVDVDDFRQVLRQFNVNLAETEFFDLTNLLDSNMDGQVNYNNFIKMYLRK